MVGQLSHCTTLTLPPSPPLTLIAATFSTPDDLECRVLRSSVPAAEHTRGEASLCETQGPLEQILDTDATMPVEASKPGAPLLHRPLPIRPSLSTRPPFTLLQKIDATVPVCAEPSEMVFTAPAQQLSPDLSRGRSLRRQSPVDSSPGRSDSRIAPRRYEGERNAVLGLSLGSSSRSFTPSDPPKSRYSLRLRSMAPPPLRLLPVLCDHSIVLTQSPSPPPIVSVQEAFDVVPLGSSVKPCLPLPVHPNAISSITEGMLATPISLDSPHTAASVSFVAAEWQDTSASPIQEVPRTQYGTIVPGATLALGPSVFVYQDRPPQYSQDRQPLHDPPPLLFEEQPHLRSMIQSVLDSPITTNLVPPPLQRRAWAPLPPISPAAAGSSTLLSPLVLDVRQTLAIDNFIVRADRCAEAVSHVALSLGSSSMLREPEQIASICETLQADFEAIQKTLDGTPEQLPNNHDEAERIWSHKHWQVVSSLDRNLDLFYLFADQISRHPPRIHRLAGHVDKLHAYHAKFADLERRLSLSHEKYRLLALRAQFLKERSAARTLLDAERARRCEFRESWQAGRARRKEVRDEIRHVRGITHTSRPGAASMAEPRSCGA